MDAITISVIIGEDRKLVVDLPADIPVGKAELTIKPMERSAVPPSTNPTRDAIKARMIADGLISGERIAPEGAIRLTDEEMMEIGRFAPGSPTVADLINQERDER